MIAETILRRPNQNIFAKHATISTLSLNAMGAVVFRVVGPHTGIFSDSLNLDLPNRKIVPCCTSRAVHITFHSVQL